MPKAWPARVVDIGSEVAHISLYSPALNSYNVDSAGVSGVWERKA